MSAEAEPAPEAEKQAFLESGNQYVIDNIVNKRLDLERARETVKKNQGALQTIVQWIQPVLEVDRSA